MPYKDKVVENAWKLAKYYRVRAEFFLDKVCVYCGSSSNLELDHIKPEDKLSHRIWGWAKERREAEQAKCQVLCIQCHKVKTKVDCANMPHYKRGCKTLK